MSARTSTAARGSRKARQYHVSPVTRAIRAALTVSATALAFAGSGVALAHTAAPVPPAYFASAQQAPAPVVDLTVVHDAVLPASVTDGFAFQAAMADSSNIVAMAGGDAMGLVESVDDLATAMPADPGPGGTSGSDDDIQVHYDTSGDAYGVTITAFDGFSIYATSTTGVAVGLFATDDLGVTVYNFWDLTQVEGYTWAAGIEVEGGTYAGVLSTDVIDATATGAAGQAWGIYAAADLAVLYNQGDISATALGNYGTAVGLAGFSPVAGEALIANTGSITATATGSYGMAIGAFASTGDGHAEVGNAGTVDVSAGMNGYGLFAFSGYGTAEVFNGNMVSVDAGNSAYGLSAASAAGDASVGNTGVVYVYGGNLATAAFASGSTAASIDNDGDLVAVSGGYAVGAFAAADSASIDNSALIVAASYYGPAVGALASGGATASVNNTGNVAAYSEYDAAVGIAAIADLATVTNTGFVDASGTTLAIGIEAIGYTGASVTNDGNVQAIAYGAPVPALAPSSTLAPGSAIGIDVYAATGNAGVANNGYVLAYSGAGDAVGVYAYAAAGHAGVTSGTAGDIVAVSEYGLADGIFASGVTVGVDNFGLIQANGYTWAAGIDAVGDDSTVVTNSGSITAYADKYVGEATGIYASAGTGGVSITNGGMAGAFGYSATGISALSTGDVAVTNNGLVYGVGIYATGIDAASVLDGGDVIVDNAGTVYGVGLLATGIQGSATGLGGTTTVTNYGTVYVRGKYAAAGIVATADGDATVDNSGAVVIDEGQYAYGVLANSFNGNALVTNSGYIKVVGSEVYTGNFAHGISAFSQNGDATVANTGYVGADGVYATGILAQTDSGVATAANSGYVSAYSYFLGATGVMAYSFTGSGVVDNSGTVEAHGYARAVGLEAVSIYGDATVANTGDVNTSSAVRDRGVFAVSLYGDVSVDNSGSIASSSYYDGSYGVWARADAGTATVSNSGSIAAASYLGNAYAVLAGGYAHVAVTNAASGSIAATAGGDAAGVYAYSLGGDVVVDNAGAIDANADYGFASGVRVTAPYGAANVTNAATGVIGATSYYGSADGILAIGTTVDVVNDGSISASGYGWAAGIEAIADDQASVVNRGDIAATVSYGEAMGVYAAGGTGASISNDGSITAHSGYGYAFGVNAASDGTTVLSNCACGSIDATVDTGLAIGMAGMGYDTTVTNSGSVTAHSGYGSAYGILAYGDTVGVTTGVDATVDATASSGDATGILAVGGLVNVSSAGTIYATASGDVYGIVALGNDAAVSNSGDVYAHSTGKYGFSAGVVASAYGDASVDNSGIVTATGGELAYGVAVSTVDGLASATNSGTVTAGGLFVQFGVGIYADSTYGDVAIDNSGLVSTTAKYAVGLMGYSAYGNVAITNAGTVGAGSPDTAIGILAQSWQGDVSVASSGGVDVTASYGFALGIGAGSDYGHAGIDNSGTVEVAAAYGVAVGITGFGDSVTVGNAGDVTVQGGYSAIGIGVQAYSAIDVTNDGTISVLQQYSGYSEEPLLVPPSYTAVGILAYGIGGQVGIANNGAIEATGDSATGIEVYGYANVVVANAGQVSAIATGDGAVGIEARSWADGGTVAVSNDGDIVAEGNSWAAGVVAVADTVDVANGGSVDALGYVWAAGIEAVGDDVNVASSGSIVAAATGDGALASGIYAFGETATITNGGSLDASSAYGEAVGIFAFTYGDLAVANTGTIAADAAGLAVGIYASSDYASVAVDSAGSIVADGIVARGILATAYGDGTVSVNNDGTIDATGVYAAEGISAAGVAVNVANGGDIAVAGAYWAAGIYADGETTSVSSDGSIAATTTDGQASGIYAYGSAALTVDNGGDIVALTGGDYFAFGISAYSGYGDTTVTNTGSIVAESSYAALGILATGVNSTTGNAGSIDVAGDVAAVGISAEGVDLVTVDNTGAVSATANGGAYGIEAFGADVAIANGGSVSATGGSFANGILAYADTIAMTNDGDVLASADGDGAEALGVQLHGGDVSFASSGSITADALGADGTAMGALLTGGLVDAANTGTVSATAGDGGQAFGLVAIGDTTTFANGGSLEASASGTYAQALGALVGSKYGDVTVSNDGDIHAVGGDAGMAFGLVATSAGDTIVDNAGDIVASGAYAVAMALYGAGTNTVDNTGLIAAEGALDYSFAIVGGDGVEEIHNAGDIFGALATGGGNDSFANASGGVWAVSGQATDFGAGDDAIVNAAGGTIALVDAHVSLGSSTSAGNTFTNAGLITVSGDSSIHMGTGEEVVMATAFAMPVANAPVVTLNPAAFVNDGTISFLDGAPDDMLTITGDFSGEGAINVDVSLLNGTSDVLYVDGNVVDGTRQALNVTVLDMPVGAANVDVPVVQIVGDSEAGQFVAGTFTIGNLQFSPSNFLDMTATVVEHLDASNAAVDRFSVTLGFAGLNDTGVLAASVATGAQSLMNTQVGTFRQRMGVFSQLGDSDKGAWVRVFHDKGSIDPTHAASFVDGNDYGVDQTNSGVEAGFNAHVADGVFVGASLAKSEGRQRLQEGAGSDELDADTAGLHLTWLSPKGWYADVSYRWMHFDAELDSAAGRQTIGGDAAAFNVEAGVTAYTSAAGLKIVPQVQYTLTEVQNIDVLHGDLVDFTNDGGNSSRARLGVEFQQEFKSASGATWTPYGSVNVIREFDGETTWAIDRTFNGGLSTEGTSAQLELGANVKVGRLNVFGGVNWTDGGALDSFLGGQLGLRYTW